MDHNWIKHPFRDIKLIYPTIIYQGSFLIIFNKIKYIFSQEVLQSAVLVVILVCAALEGKEQVSD